MLAILTAIIIVGFILYYFYKAGDLSFFAIYFSLIVAFIICCLFYLVPCICSTDHEYSIPYDSYCCSDDDTIFGYYISYYSDGQLYRIHAYDVDTFNGGEKGYFVVIESRFDAPDWFWLIMFIPDNMLTRTEVLIH